MKVYESAPSRCDAGWGGQAGSAQIVRSLTLGILAFVVVVGACGGAAEPPPPADLSSAGEAGRSAVRTAGCAACHGFDGEGVEGLGPSFIGLSGSQVALEEGVTVMADREYLRRSITEPDAEIVEGFGLPMPPYELAEADLEAILDYLDEIG